MEFDDAVLVRLADPAARANLFDQDALAQVLAVGYDHPELEGPYSAVFDEVRVGVDLAPAVTLDGAVQRLGDAVRHQVTASIAGLADPAVPRLTGLWRGAVVARARPAQDRVTTLTQVWGPGGPAATATDTLRLQYADPAATPSTARPLPVTVAVLARRSAGSSPGALLADTAVLRERLTSAGVEPAAAQGLRRRIGIVVAWVLPPETFDDPGWPGADRAGRRSAAADWLALQGVALTTATLS